MQGSREARGECRKPDGGAQNRFASPSSVHDLRPIRAFTLLEIMMVVAIIGLLMTMGVPSILRAIHQAPLRKAVNDVMNICSHARDQAILHDVTTSVIFYPRLREVTLAPLTATNATDDFSSSNPSAGDSPKGTFNASALNSTRIADSITIDMLDINFVEYKDADVARVHFFPNGTSDEMTLILHSGAQYRKITLEVTTGLTSLEVIR